MGLFRHSRTQWLIALCLIGAAEAFVNPSAKRISPLRFGVDVSLPGRVLPRLSSSDASEPEESSRNRRRPFLERVASVLSQSFNTRMTAPAFRKIQTEEERRIVQITTLLRVSIPSIAAGVLATISFPALSLLLATNINDAGVFSVLSQDASQFVQNFLTVSGLLFSILVGQTYYFLYTQQESIYYALFLEVTEAKSLLEQVALVCQGRSMYKQCLDSIAAYVNQDLKNIQADPAVLLSARPVDDPLESIMYMTSVGVPSSVYETVKSLREARAARLGALQRKLPKIHMLLLWILAMIQTVSFPLLGAGTQTIGGYHILTVEGLLFGVMTAGIVLTLRVVGELWRPTGGAYNVDAVLSVMVSGLEEELKARREGSSVYASNRKAPSAPNEQLLLNRKFGDSPSPAERLVNKSRQEEQPLQQGANIGIAGKRLYSWIKPRHQQRRNRNKF